MIENDSVQHFQLKSHFDMKYFNLTRSVSYDFKLRESFEIYVRLTNTPVFKRQLENWLFKSMEIFFPRYLASTIIALDSEKEQDWEFANSLLQKYKKFDLRVCYMNPVPKDVVHNWGKERMYFDMMNVETCKSNGYVGFVDVDTMFVTAVTEDLLFENGKPIVTGRIGIPRIPCWIKTAEYVLGKKQVMQCMSYFPVVFKVQHIAKMRQYVESLHKKSFMQVFKLAPAATKVADSCYCHYSIMCNYMWYFHREEYAWHLQVVPLGKWDGKGAIPSMVDAAYFDNEVLPSEKIPIPRSSIHVRHFMQKGKYHNAVEAPLAYTNKVLKEGFCYSFGMDVCPENCKEFDAMKLQESLFSFENYRWQWDPRCLTTQVTHYAIVKNFLRLYPHEFIVKVTNRKEICTILNELS